MPFGEIPSSSSACGEETGSNLSMSRVYKNGHRLVHHLSLECLWASIETGQCSNRH